MTSGLTFRMSPSHASLQFPDLSSIRINPVIPPIRFRGITSIHAMTE
jgi:hypothetical protein